MSVFDFMTCCVHIPMKNVYANCGPIFVTALNDMRNLLIHGPRKLFGQFCWTCFGRRCCLRKLGETFHYYDDVMIPALLIW